MNELGKLREKIDKLDEKLLKLLAQRLFLSKEIGKIKKNKNLKIRQIEREKEITERMLGFGKKLGIKKSFVSSVIRLLLEESRKLQK